MNLAEALDFARASGVPDVDTDGFLLLAGAVAAAPALAALGATMFDETADPLGYRTVPLRQWSDPRGMDIDMDALRIAAQASNMSRRSIRLAFRKDVDDELIDRLRASAKPWQRSFSRVRSDGPITRALDWPIRIGVPQDFLSSLTAHTWAPPLIFPVDPTRAGARPHLVVGDAGWIRDWADIAPERASLALVVGPDPSPDELFAVVGRAAGAWAHLPGASPDRVADVAATLIVELSHNWTVDEALTRIADLGDPPVLVAPPAWLATSRLTSAIARVGERQDRLQAIDSRRPAQSHRRPTPPAPRDADVAASLAVQFRDRTFVSEISDASDAAPALHDARALIADRDDRYLTADVMPAPGDNVKGARLTVWIAPLDTVGAAVAPDRFADEALPWDGVAIPLDVVLFELRDGGFTARRRVGLPPHGPSTKAEFDLRWSAGPFRARVVVFHAYRFVQSMLLTVAATGLHVSLDHECLIRPADSDLLDATPSQGAIVLNDHGGPLLAVATSAGEEIRAPQGLDDLRKSMTTLLTRVVDEPDAFTSLADPKYVDLIVEFARRGTTLRDVLFTGEATAVAPAIYEELRQADRISVFSAVPSHILPLEFVYEPKLRIPLGQRGSVCERAQDVLTGPAPDVAGLLPACVLLGDQGTCGATEAQVCPLGFWGMRKVIERHTNRATHVALERDYAVSTSPSSDRPTVDVTRVLAAATPKADANPVEAWRAAREALMARLGDDLVVEQDWLAIIDRFAPGHTPMGMMVLVPHVDKDRNGQLRLDLGSEPTMPVHDVATQLELRSDHPVVLLLGCVTGPSESPTEEFPGRFLDAGAAAVLATMTMVRGRFVSDIARAVVVSLRDDIVANQWARMGDAVLRVRQTMLATNPFVLTLVAYGDADWILIGRPPGQR